METIEQISATEVASPDSPAPTDGVDIVAEQLRTAQTEEERACILASCIGETIGRFSSLRLTELDIRNNPLYKTIRTKLEG